MVHSSLETSLVVLRFLHRNSYPLKPSDISNSATPYSKKENLASLSVTEPPSEGSRFFFHLVRGSGPCGFKESRPLICQLSCRVFSLFFLAIKARRQQCPRIFRFLTAIATSTVPSPKCKLLCMVNWISAAEEDYQGTFFNVVGTEWLSVSR